MSYPPFGNPAPHYPYNQQHQHPAQPPEDAAVVAANFLNGGLQPPTTYYNLTIPINQPKSGEVKYYEPVLLALNPSIPPETGVMTIQFFRQEGPLSVMNSLGLLQFRPSQVPPPQRPTNEKLTRCYSLYQARENLRVLTARYPESTSLYAIVSYQENISMQAHIIDNLTLKSFIGGEQVGESGYMVNENSLAPLADAYNSRPSRFA